MKQLLSTYSISGNVVTLTGVNRPRESVLSITNATTGAILYTAQTGGATSYTQGTNSTITLATTPNASDRLQIFYDDGVAPANANNTALSNIDADIGNVADAAASSDTGSFSLIALTKRLLGKLNDGTQTTRIVNGANTLAVDSSGSITAALAPTLVQTYSSTGAVAVNTMAIGPVNISSFRQITIYCSSFASGGNFAFEVSNDGANWSPIVLNRVDGSTSFYTQPGLFATGAWTSPSFGFVHFRLRVSSAFSSGTNAVTAAFSNAATPSPTQNVVISGNVNSIPNITSGATAFFNFHTLVSASGTNLTQVGSGQRNIGSIWLSNSTASFRWFKIWNLASGSVILGTTSPSYNVGIPPNSTIVLDLGYMSHRFSAFSYAITGGSALLDNTSISAGDVAVNISHF